MVRRLRAALSRAKARRDVLRAGAVSACGTG